MEVLISLIEDLDNIEMSGNVLDILESKELLNVSNCISRMKQKQRLEVSVDRESDFIASRFYSLKLETISDIEIPILKNILRSDSLLIDNEDSLIELILGLGPNYFELIGSIRFEYLSSSSIDLFFDQISFEDINADIWHQLHLRSRHLLVYERNSIPRNRFKDLIFRSADSDSPWSGLISCRCEECGGNVHEKGIVNITCSSTCYNQCWQIVNYDWKSYFYTNNSANSWIQFDFKDRSVSLSHYALKSDGNHGSHLLQWKLSGSNDGNDWTTVDERNTQELNGTYLTKMFCCRPTSSVSQSYRYIRLTQTGKNSTGEDYLLLANIEFFGSMVNSAMKGLMVQT
jgi:hypothetical protein